MNAEREIERLVAELPRIGQRFAVLPTTAAFLAAVVKRVPFMPLGTAAFGPDDLRIRAHQNDIAPTLLLHAVAAIEQLIILPAVCENE